LVDETLDRPLRLDRYAAERLALLSRSQLKARCVSAFVNDKPVKISYLVKAGDRLSLTWTASEPLDLIPEDLPLTVLYEDERLVVINKEQGMVVHPGAGNHRGTLANALLFRRAQRGSAPIGATTAPSWRQGIVHRLDKDTSGVMIAAYNDETRAFLAAQFKNRHVRKLYAAIVQGTPPEQAGVIETFITRDSRDRTRFTASARDGKAAVTRYRVLRSWGAYSLLLLRPKTGRTHQLRVHLRHLGHPILGDPIYGVKDTRFPAVSLMLHAKTLGIALPGDEEACRRVFVAPLPPRFLAVVRALSGG
jgi:23S rRNA pseudouridine1911/1915/1917 synthase